MSNSKIEDNESQNGRMPQSSEATKEAVESQLGSSKAETSSVSPQVAQQLASPADTPMDVLNKVDPNLATILVRKRPSEEEGDDNGEVEDVFNQLKVTLRQERRSQADIDHENDPTAALKLATDLNVHRASIFIDHFAATKEEYALKMQTFNHFAYLSSQNHQNSLDHAKSSEMKTRRTITQTIQLLDTDKGKEKTIKSEVEGTEVSDWTAKAAQDRILKAIQTSTVSKPKEKKKKDKKKKKGAVPTPLEIFLTPEEILLDYEITVAEEKAKEHLLAYKMAEKEGRILEDQHLSETRKRYDQEMQACKVEFMEDETELRSLEDHWRRSIQQTEEGIAKTRVDTEQLSVEIKEKVVSKQSKIKILEREIAAWEKFRQEEMACNNTKIQKLEKDIQRINESHQNFLELTMNEIANCEEQAKLSEKEALEKLCDEHISLVRDRLPPSELLEIDKNISLAAEAKALQSVKKTLEEQTDELQKKIIHQAATAQTLLESINQSINTNIAKTRLFTKWDIWDKIDSTDCYKTEELFNSFHQLDEVRCMTGGLTVVGTGVFSRRPFTYLATHQSSMNSFTTQSYSTANIKAGFSLEVPKTDISRNALMLSGIPALIQNSLQP